MSHFHPLNYVNRLLRTDPFTFAVRDNVGCALVNLPAMSRLAVAIGVSVRLHFENVHSPPIKLTPFGSFRNVSLRGGLTGSIYFYPSFSLSYKCYFNSVAYLWGKGGWSGRNITPEIILYILVILLHCVILWILFFFCSNIKNVFIV